MLGHAQLTTIEIYTHVAIRKLKEIHAATHPGARPAGQEKAEAKAEMTAAPNVQEPMSQEELTQREALFKALKDEEREGDVSE